MLFHTMIVALCVIRSPTPFALSCTIFAMMMRILMIFGYYCNKKLVYITASSIEVFMNIMMLLIAMSYS